MSFLLGIIVFHLLVVLVFVFIIAFPIPLTKRDYGQPSDHGLEYEKTALADGSDAWFLPNKEANKTVLICHGRSRNKSWMLPLCVQLAKKYRVFVFDFPSHGKNPYRTTTIGLRESETVGHALDWLENRHQKDPVFVYGVSMGGVAAMLYLGRVSRESVKKLVTDGSFDDLKLFLGFFAKKLWLPNYIKNFVFNIAGRLAKYELQQVRPIALADRLTMPTLFLHGEHDWFVPKESAKRLAEKANSTFHLYNGSHDEPDNENMQKAVLQFFQE